MLRAKLAYYQSLYRLKKYNLEYGFKALMMLIADNIRATLTITVSVQ